MVSTIEVGLLVGSLVGNVVVGFLVGILVGFGVCDDSGRNGTRVQNKIIIVAHPTKQGALSSRPGLQDDTVSILAWNAS